MSFHGEYNNNTVVPASILFLLKKINVMLKFLWIAAYIQFRHYLLIIFLYSCSLLLIFLHIDMLLVINRVTGYIYKLASITALYIALKVHNRTTIKASTLSNLSRGEITVGDIIAMESMMLNALSYHLCPPTCYTFINLFYTFVPISVRESPIGHQLMQHAVFLAELSVMDISFQCLKASHIALAAMMNVMDLMGEEVLPSSVCSRFAHDVMECCILKRVVQNQQDDQHRRNDVNNASIDVDQDNDKCLSLSSSSSSDNNVLSQKLWWHCVDHARHLFHTLMIKEGYSFDFMIRTGSSRQEY